jgi:hypothetical protein
MLTLAASGAALAAGDPQTPPAPAPSPSPVASPAPARDAGRDIEDFVPTEKVSADDAVAFPTDI